MQPQERVRVPTAPVARATTLAPRAPYDFRWATRWLRTSSSAILEVIDSDDTYYRALTLDGRDVVLTLRSTGTLETPRLTLEVHGGDGDAALTAQAEQFIRRVFLLDADPVPFTQAVRGDAVMHALATRYAGFRPLLVASPYEALLWAIIGQQVNVTFARSLKHALVALCGRPLSTAGRTLWLMPRAEDVAALDPALLRDQHFSRQKASYVIGVSEAVATGALNLEALAELPFAEAVAALTRFKGIGRWTAEYVLMRGLGAPDSIPAGDLGLRAIIGRAYGLGRTATEAEVRALAAHWTNWRGWAAFCWWLALQRGD